MYCMEEDDEANEILQVIQIKKEKFRVEIRKSKQKQEFAQKRLKLIERSNQTSQNQNEIEDRSNQKESFFDQFKVDDNENINDNGNFSKNSYFSSPKRNENQGYINNLLDQNNEETKQTRALLEEIKDHFQNGNRKPLHYSLCSLRRILAIASSQIEAAASMKTQRNSVVEDYPMVEMNKRSDGVQIIYLIINDEEIIKLLMEVMEIYDPNSQSLAPIQDECMWIFINLCAGRNGECQRLIKLGILNTFKKVMEITEDLPILENLFWCLGNLAADDAETREQLFQDSSAILTAVSTFYQKILKRISGPLLFSSCSTTNSNNLIEGPQTQEQIQRNNQSGRNSSVVEELTFFLTNLIKKHPMPRIEALREILRILKELFFIDLNGLKIQIMKSLRQLADSCEMYADEVIRLDMLKYVAPLLVSRSSCIVKESLEFLSVMASKCDDFTRSFFVQTKFQGYLEIVLSQNSTRECKIRVIGLLGRIIDSTNSNNMNLIAEILTHERLLIKLVYMLVMEDFGIKAKLLSLFLEFLTSDMAIQKLLQLEYLQIILKLAKSKLPDIERLCLLSLDLLLQYGQSLHNADLSDQPINSVLNQFYQFEGESILNELQNSPSQQISSLSVSIIQNYLD